MTMYRPERQHAQKAMFGDFEGEPTTKKDQRTPLEEEASLLLLGGDLT